MRTFLLLALLPIAAEAQLVIYAVNGSTQTVVGSTYQFGQVGLATTSTVQFRVYNTGTAPVSVNVTLGGAGFVLNSQALPFTIQGNSTVSQTLNFAVAFTPLSTASYSASLQVNSTSIILLGSGVAAPTLVATAGGCAGSTFSFGSVPAGTTSTCAFTLSNFNPQAVTVPTMAVNGLSFSGPTGVTVPLTLQAGQSVSFSITFAPQAAIVYNGTLAVGTQTYSLTGTGISATLPAPVLAFDSGAFSSAQQRTLTMTIPGGSPVAASGYVNIAFTPATAVVQKDSGVVFLAGSASSIPFTVAAGATQVLLNGQASATFGTGTTEGTITFTVTTTSLLAGDPTTKVTIPGTPVVLDSMTASKQRTGYLDITIAGADNTYSAGQMSFVITDTTGKTLANASADFSAQFKSYFANVSNAGSAFSALISFPVVGSVANIGAVTVTIVNAAGSVSTGSLTFN